MSLLTTFKYITSHPLTRNSKTQAIVRFIKWQLKSRLSSNPIICHFVENTYLIAEKGMTGATGNVYTGLHEFAEMGFLLHFLREDDLFIDVGANIGSYTILAAGVSKAKTTAIEPSLSTFKKLQRNISFNNLEDTVKAVNIGLGSEKGELRFTKSLDTVNHIVKDEIFDKENTETINVERFDDLFHKLEKTTLIKIDVEGFEAEVLKGAESSLKDQNLKAIIIELNGSGWRYGFDENKIHQNLITNGFQPFVYNPLCRKLERKEKYGPHNTIYIKDIAFAEQRTRSSKVIKVFDKSF